jgi:hypothetical protein
MIQRRREVDQASLHRYDDLQKTELSAILESRRPRKSGGTKAILIDRLKVDDLEHPTRKFAMPVDDLEFLTVCRPSWDKEVEQKNLADLPYTTFLSIVARVRTKMTTMTPRMTVTTSGSSALLSRRSATAPCQRMTAKTALACVGSCRMIILNGGGS